MNIGNSDKISIVVSNYLGVTVLFQQVTLVNTNYAFSVNGLERLPEGNYIITLTWESGKKIIKQFTKAIS
jgi:hypothetical protein